MMANLMSNVIFFCYVHGLFDKLTIYSIFRKLHHRSVSKSAKMRTTVLFRFIAHRIYRFGLLLSKYCIRETSLRNTRCTMFEYH